MNKVTDESLVPLRWVLISLGISCGAMGSVIVGAMAIGGWTTRVSVTQEVQAKQIESHQAGLDKLNDSQQRLENQVIDRLGRIEAKIDGLKAK